MRCGSSFIRCWPSHWRANPVSRLPNGLPLLLLVLVALVQLIYPTVLGWAAIILPTAIYGALGVWTVASDFTRTSAHWESDPSGLVLGIVFLAVVLAVFAGLVRAGLSLRVGPRCRYKIG